MVFLIIWHLTVNNDGGISKKIRWGITQNKGIGSLAKFPTKMERCLEEKKN
jgi:hypothetical protein